MNEAEWQTLLGDHVVREDILGNIDDCYVDKIESDEKAVIIDHAHK